MSTNFSQDHTNGDLFSSTTANNKYNLFFGPQEMHLFNHYNTEVLEIISNQSIIYWAVEADLSNMDDLYGESEAKSSRQPVQIWCYVELEEPETISGEYTTEVKRNINCFMHKDRLTEIGIVPRVGDFIEWDEQFFEIVSAIVPNFVFGLPAGKIGVNVRAISVGEDKFNPRIQNVYNVEGESDSKNPY